MLNSSESLSTSPRSENAPVTAITIVLAILIFISVVGNSLVCYAFVIQPRLRRILYYPVLSLAVADVLCGLVAMTSYLAKKHVFGGTKERVVCDISRFSYFVTEYASVLSLAIISVDRLLAIVRPLTYKTTVTSRRMKAALAVAWFDASFIASLPFFWRKSRGSCSFRATREWSAMVILINVFVPFLVIFLSQACVYAIAIKHSISIKMQRDVAIQASMRRGSTPQTEAWVLERKATVTLSVVVGLFVLCWGPSSFYYFLKAVDPEHFSGTFGRKQELFNAVVKLLTFANSCFNPVIYAWMNKDFRRAFLRVLSRRLYRSVVEQRARGASRSASGVHVGLTSFHVKQTDKLLQKLSDSS